MAFRLDPQGQPEPLYFSTSRQNGLALEGYEDPNPPIADLAPGVSIASVLNDQNTFMLLGPADALDQWQRVIEELDKPLRQIEVEAQFVRLSPQALTALGAPAATAELLALPDAAPNAGFAKLRGLVAAKQAKLVTAPRVAAIDGMAVVLQTRIAPSVRLDMTLAAAGAAKLPTTPVSIQEGVDIVAQPRLQADGSVEMKMAMGRSWSVQTNEGNAPWQRMQRARAFSSRFESGRLHIVYTAPNFDLPAAGAPGTPQADKDGWVSAIIIIARPVRRFNEDQAEQR